MARKAPLKDLPQEERPEFVAQLAALDGVDQAEFPALARQAAERYHDAVLAGHVDVLAEAETAYSALVYVLNGSTFFGCGADDDSPWYVLERAVAAAPGQVPRWGQAGHFLLEVDGMRVRVKLSSNMLGNHRSGALHAVDLDKPFLSETGYRSSGLIVSASLGETVDQAARAMVLDILKSEGGPKPIRSDDRERLRSAKVPAWLADALAGVKPDGQLAMFGDAPPARVAKDAAQRQRDARRRRKEQGLKSVMMSEAERQLLEKIREQFEASPGIGNEKPLKGTYGYANGDFTMFDVGDVDLIAVWKSSRTDFFKVAVALGTLTLRNRQHAELGRAVEVLQARLRAAGLSDQVGNDKQPWYWNKCPPRDYRPMSAPEYMERLGQIPTLADELISAKESAAYYKEQVALLTKEAQESRERNYQLHCLLRDAGLPTDLPPRDRHGK